MNRSRPPNEAEQKIIRELWSKGLGSPKISQIVRISSFYILRWMKENGLVRTRAEMLRLRKENGINFRTQTVPRKSFQL